MTVHAADVKLDVGQNRLWIDGPGVAEHGAQARALAGRRRRRRRRSNSAGRAGSCSTAARSCVERGVAVDGPDDRLRCDELAARLTSKVNFGKRVDQNAIDVEEVECSGRRGDGPPVARRGRHHVARADGARAAHGESADGRDQRHGAGRDPLDALCQSTAGAGRRPARRPNPLPSSDAKLHFLRVDFQQGLAGNLINREITFLTRVRTVYGPVDAWEQELDGNRPELLPPDTITLTSEQLRVNEDPLCRQPSQCSAGRGRTARRWARCK